jgi:uncharacterized protein
MIHKFVFDGERFVFDVHSGALHIVDELVWDILEEYEQAYQEDFPSRFLGRYPEEAVSEAVEEIKELVEKKILFSPDPFAGGYTPPQENIIKALCLHLAHDCNLSCRYCFAGQGKFGGVAGLMTPEVGRRAIEFLVESSGERRHLEIDFFGGEPLLNFEVLAGLVAYGRELAAKRGKEIKFTCTTNAVLLDRQKGDFLNKNNISVILSLDGRQGIHDAMRPFPNGNGSYGTVLKNIKSFLQSRNHQDYYVRGTFTALNTDFAEDVQFLADQGFDHISLEPVVADAREHYCLREDMLPAIAREYDRLARIILKMKREGRPINFFHFNIDFEGGPCLPKRMNGCGAGFQYLAVDPGGTLYPCHQFVGQSEFVMGDVYGGLRRADLADLFKNAHLYKKEGCSSCWAKYYCSGGCHANAYMHNGSLLKPYATGCAMTRKRLECAMYLAQGNR